MDSEREVLAKEQRLAQMSKFGTMKKKANFVKATGPFTFFKDTNSFEIGTKYVDDRDKIKQIQPDRAFKKNIPKWNLFKTCDGDTF